MSKWFSLYERKMEEFQKLTGLTSEQVKINREKFGSNYTDDEKHGHFWPAVKDIVSEPLFVILVGAALIYFVLGEYNEGVIMLVALAFVSGISLYQESRSREAVDALKKLNAPQAKVIRNGSTEWIKSEEIVLEDLIVVEDGQIVPADASIVRLNDFSVNESILTGESLPVFKSANPPDNVIFKGTVVMTGSCVARVTHIGKETKLDQIGQSLKDIEVVKTPLQIQIKSFIRLMVIAGAIAFVLVWGLNFYMTRDWLHGLLHGLTLAMSVLPEEIPVAFSTFMALGAYHLYKKRVIVRTPYTVETLGAATVICVDKTGTITENEMRLSSIYDFERKKVFDYTKEPYNYTQVLEYALWASETEPFDAMEKSIHTVYESVAVTDKRKEYKLIHEYPLGGSPPIMTHVFRHANGHSIIACKGGVEGVLNQSQISHSDKIQVEQIVKEFTSKGFRVLAVGYSKHDASNLPVSQHEFEFVFVGLVAFYDPPKKNIPSIFQRFYDAGIQVKMITGDHAQTAVSIANQVQMKNTAAVLTGTEVMSMNEAELKTKVKTVNVFARMFPDAKLKIIEALKENGEVVAMTGDGVNDGPALKAAHIGIAMGLRGSEVAKRAAALILMDDDLMPMMDAVALGRRIYENLKKAIQYIISIHIPIILIVTIPLMLFWKFTDLFSPVHVIFLELIMGPTCSIIFENEPIESNSMQKGPRKMTTSFFSLTELSMSILQGVIITVACLGIGYFTMQAGESESSVRTVIYTTLIFSNLFLTLVNRSFYFSVITTLQYKNRLIPIILTISLVVLFLSIYVAPVRTIFQFTSLNSNQLLICLGVAFTGVMWIEILKWWRRTG